MSASRAGASPGSDWVPEYVYGVAVTLVIVEVQSVPSTRLVTAMPIVTVVLIVIGWLVPNWVQVVPFVE